MGREFTEEELKLATVAIEDDEKESKKPQQPRSLIYRPYAPEGFLPSWPIKKKILEEIKSKELPIMKPQQPRSVTHCSFVSERFLPSWSITKKLSVSRDKKKGENSSSDHAEKGVQEFSIVWDETFKNSFEREKEDGLVQKVAIIVEGEVIAQKGLKRKVLEKTESPETKRPRISENGFIQENKRRKNSNNAGNDVKKSKKASNVCDNGPNPPPALPEEFKKMISELGEVNISDVKLVVQKKLEESDCNVGHNRFSIPKANLCKHFLQDVEKGGKRQTFNIIDPSLNHYQIGLSNWKPFYALNGENWKTIRQANNLRSGMIMQLWGFRVNNELWFALVNLENNLGTEEAEKGADHGESSTAGGASE